MEKDVVEVEEEEAEVDVEVVVEEEEEDEIVTEVDEETIPTMPSWETETEDKDPRALLLDPKEGLERGHQDQEIIMRGEDPDLLEKTAEALMAETDDPPLVTDNQDPATAETMVLQSEEMHLSRVKTWVEALDHHSGEKKEGLLTMTEDHHPPTMIEKFHLLTMIEDHYFRCF